MGRVLGELITFENGLGLALDGILYSEDKNSTTVIHIHGSVGNFYQNSFVRKMAVMYGAAGINLLSFNTASHDGLAEGYRDWSVFQYIGGAISDFGECVADIEGAVKFARRFSTRIVLQGHSLGCDRVVHFLTTKEASYEFILLSPCDSYELQVNWIAPETVERQIERLKVEKPSDPECDWLPSREYGVRQGKEWTYSIPITRRALLSIMQGPPYRLFKIREPANFSLPQRALIYLGGNDALQAWPQDVMFEYLQERIRNATKVYVPDGDHMLGGCEMVVIGKIVEWLCT